MISYFSFIIFVILLLPIIFIALIRWVNRFSKPNHTPGVTDNALAPCPSTPNCYSSRQKNTIMLESKQSVVQTKSAIMEAMHSLPRTLIQNQTEDYIHYTQRTRLLGFVDDIEFYFPEGAQTIQYRSSSRVGHGDMGTNEKRIHTFAYHYNNAQVD